MLISPLTLQKKYNMFPKGVLHVGASSGQEIPMYVQMGIKKMVMIEALENPYNELWKTISKTHKENPDVVIRCYRACISDEDGKKVTFHISDNDAQSSSFLAPKLHLQEHPTVHFPETVEMETQTLATLFKTNYLDPNDYDFLNMDIQGAELLALKGMGDLLHSFKWIYLEVNNIELYEGCGLVGEVDAYLASFGFRGVEEKWTGHGWGDKYYIK